MADMTRAQLVNEIADVLNIGSSGQTLPDEYYSYIDDRVNAVLDEMVQRDVIPYAPRDEFPTAWYNPLVECCANEIGPRFGIPKNDAVRQAAEERLKVVLRLRPAGRYLRMDKALRNSALPGTYRG